MAWPRNIGILPWHSIPLPHVYRSGEAFFSRLLQGIAEAKESIYLQVYIFESDQTGAIIFNALTEAARRGVYVNLQLDAYGSKNFEKVWVQKLKTLDADISFYSQLKTGVGIPMGLRLHHKIFVFDRQTALMGGINISDHYSHWGTPETWTDYGVELHGDVVTDLLRICIKINKGLLPLARQERKELQYFHQKGNVKARILQNHWTRVRFGISRQYKQSIRNAEKELVMVSSYFLPSPALKRLLRKAARKGVKVQLILGGISDVPLITYATHHLYQELFKAGVEIWEWKSGVLHAKLAFADDNWVCMGSYNINRLSDLGSVECNIEIRNQEFHHQFLQLIRMQADTEAVQIMPAEFSKKLTWYNRIRNFMAYRTISFAMQLLFILQRSKPATA